jgi:hypothetical protein
MVTGVPSGRLWLGSPFGAFSNVVAYVPPSSGGPSLRDPPGFAWIQDGYLVDSASSHMLVSKIKPCMSKYKQFIP